MKPAAMTVVLDDAGERVLLSWRHRFVPDVWNWELPGGLLDPNETPEETAAREVVTAHSALRGACRKRSGQIFVCYCYDLLPISCSSSDVSLVISRRKVRGTAWSCSRCTSSGAIYSFNTSRILGTLRLS